MLKGTKPSPSIIVQVSKNKQVTPGSENIENNENSEDNHLTKN